MRISDGSSDVCSSDLACGPRRRHTIESQQTRRAARPLDRSCAVEDRRNARGPPERHASPGGGPPRVVGTPTPHRGAGIELCNAACREREGQSVEISVVAVALKNKNTIIINPTP